MTKEEMFNKNINLAYKVFNKYRGCGIETEDLKQICLYAFWKSVCTYKSEKGYELSSYAYRVIMNEINFYIRKNKKYFTDKSISEEIAENITLEETLMDESDYIEELEKKMDIKFYMEKIFRNASKENEKKIIELYLQGYRQKQIADKIGCSQPQVSRTIKKIKNIFKEIDNEK